MTGAAVLAVATSRRITLPSDVSVGASEEYNAPFLISVSGSVTFGRNGNITVADEGGNTVVGTWCLAPHSTVGDNFYVKYDYSGDALEVGSPADNTYVQLNTDRTFTQTQSGGVGSDSTTGTFSVARDSGGSGAKTCTGTISAELT